ncbi:MAG: type II toxin-antitoxin system RelE/ParE family toxin [Methylobacteriaceae bacterium]|nr:type II toxin-antitoxin system RelE/ParE family toxin [Methylobacteriaceae bacterium]
MRIFKTKWFIRFARSEQIRDSSLREAIDRARSGLIDADLGGGIIKQRVARQGKGRSGGYRVLVAYRDGTLAVFLYGFAKSSRANIEEKQLATLRDIAAGWLNADASGIAVVLRQGLIEEVDYDGGKEKN